MNIAKEVTLIANTPEVFEVAAQAKDDFASRSRLINIEGDAVRAVSAAYKTASGLYSEAEGQITTCIYNMRKLDIALLIARNDDSDDAFDRAAFEVARDAFVSGKLDSKAESLAQATGRPVEACYNLIYRKLAEMTSQMNARSNLLRATGEAPDSPEAVRDAILANGGKYLLSLPTGYGKTSKIIEPVLQHYMDAGKKVLVISHRRSINKNIANLPGIVSYDECNSPEVIERAQGLKIVVNSLAANKFKGFIESVDLVVIDEASQVISHVLGGEVKERQAVWKALNLVVKRAANVILSDADIDTRCADLIGEARLYSVRQDHSGIDAQGFQVTVLDHNDELSKSGYSANNQGRKAAKDEVVQKLLGSNAASQNLVAKVRDSGSGDEHEHFQVIRARAEAVMGVEELTEDDAKVWGLGEGESKIKSYRAVFSGVLYETAEQADAAELLRQAASRMSGSAWLGEDSVGLYDSLNRMRSDVFILGIKMGNPRSEQAKKAEVTKIFAQLGLKVKRRESTGHRFYAITPASIAQMNRYV